MKKIKHSKFKNTGFIFELLVRQVTSEILSSTTFPAGTISYSTLPVLIGASYGADPLGEFFTGNIYSVKIYNKILTAQEVLQNYEGLKSRYGL